MAAPGRRSVSTLRTYASNTRVSQIVNLGLATSPIQGRLTEENQDKLIAALAAKGREILRYDWFGFWARDKQLPPQGN
jgi:hypothetical protein